MKKLAKAILKLCVTTLLLVGLCASASAIEMKTGIGTVNAGSLRLRASADTESSVLNTAANGDKVVIIRKINDWYLVDYNLTVGYMSADYLDFDPVKNINLGKGKASESSANVRSAPSADSDTLAQMPMGSLAEIIGFNNGWYKVNYNDTTGYVRSDLLALTEKPSCNSSGGSGMSLAQTVLSAAKNYLGCAYVWGGTTPNGFDCSGYIRYVLRECGISIGRTAYDQFQYGTSVSKDNLALGDLVFFNGRDGSYIGHVGMYIGNGQFIHAGGSSVHITSLSDSYYSTRYVGAKRIF